MLLEGEAKRENENKMSFSQPSFAPLQGKTCCLAAHLPALGCDLRVSPALKSDGAESSLQDWGN